MSKKMRGMSTNDFCNATEILMSEEFRHIMYVATKAEGYFVQINLLLQVGVEDFQLFYLDNPLRVLQDESMEQLLHDGAVQKVPITIRKSDKDYSTTLIPRTEMQEAIARLHNYREDEFFFSSARQIKYKDENVEQKDAPMLFAVLFGRKNEWPYYQAITDLFGHYVTYINSKKESFSKLSLRAFNVRQAAMKVSNAPEIIRRACESTLYSLFNTSEKPLSPKDSTYFDFVCNLACMPYEGSTNKGIIRFTSPSVMFQSLIRFQNTVSCLEDNTREVRKLLEMTDDETALLVYRGFVLGLVKDKKYKSLIKFNGNGKWSIHKENAHSPVISVEGNSIRYHMAVLEDQLSSVYTKVFGDNEHFEVIKRIVDAASQQKHGTSIIISKYAADEAKRLAMYSRGIRIEPLPLIRPDKNIDEKLIKSLTAIDGALIISPDGICHAIGAILDGEACCEGSKARGARYNSLLNYVKWKKNNLMAVVISEDQSVDYLYAME